mmetsp:Transcript_8564/g.33692  ORF Transcript_8564/g.33692 Transcript_8564/m.33692 type:complete len:238 (+) Transcript_8564:511-1224(+)
MLCVSSSTSGAEVLAGTRRERERERERAVDAPFSPNVLTRANSDGWWAVTGRTRLLRRLIRRADVWCSVALRRGFASRVPALLPLLGEERVLRNRLLRGFGSGGVVRLRLRGWQVHVPGIPRLVVLQRPERPLLDRDPPQDALVGAHVVFHVFNQRGSGVKGYLHHVGLEVSLPRRLELVRERPRAERGDVGDDAARVEHAGARPPQDVGELRPRRRRLDDDHELVEDHGRSGRCRN